MYCLNEILQDCREDLETLGIEYGKVRFITINYKTTSWLGQVRTNSEGCYDIQVSSTLVNENNPRNLLQDVIMHELLHTCKGCWKHTGLWKEYADKVNNTLGYNVHRCTSIESIVVDERNIVIKHKFQCEDCGCIVNRQRESKFTKHPENYICNKCGGNFIKIF